MILIPFQVVCFVVIIQVYSFANPMLELASEYTDANDDSVNSVEDWINSYTEFTDYDDYSSHSHLTIRDVNYDKKKYFQTCGKTIRMRKNTKIRIVSTFHGEKQYLPGTVCDWNFLGNSQCKPKIVCPIIDLRTEDNADCSKEYLLIFDGKSGWLELCNENSSLSKPLKAFHGNNLFVMFQTGSSPNFTRVFNGIECVVSCDTKGDAEKLPQKSGIFTEVAACECGRLKPSQQRIVGGKEVTPFEFPWVAAIVNHKTRFVKCGASIINSQYVLTAAHCFSFGVKIINSTDLEVVIHLQNTQLTDAAEESERFTITKIICHPFYRVPKSFSNDVCVLKLNRMIDLIKHTPVCLPPVDTVRSELNRKIMTVVGWGSLDYNFGGPSPTLQKVEIPVISSKRCVEQHSERRVDTVKMMCVGALEGGKDACKGDSGGPLMQLMTGERKGANWYQFGIVSWGDKCALPNITGVYTYLPVMVPWIKRQTMDASWCKSDT